MQQHMSQAICWKVLSEAFLWYICQNALIKQELNVQQHPIAMFIQGIWRNKR
jgi:hypothetical protein